MSPHQARQAGGSRSALTLWKPMVRYSGWSLGFTLGGIRTDWEDVCAMQSQGLALLLFPELVTVGCRVQGGCLGSRSGASEVLMCAQVFSLMCACVRAGRETILGLRVCPGRVAVLAEDRVAKAQKAGSELRGLSILARGAGTCQDVPESG
jgi:hypothetical protein